MMTKPNMHEQLAVLSFGLLAILQSHAAPVVWTNTSGGNWNVAANWSPPQVPGTGDNAIITNNGTYTVTLDTSPTLASLTLGGASGVQMLAVNGYALTLDALSTVGTNAVVNFNGGIIAGSGEFIVNGALNWAGGQISSVGGVTANGTLLVSGGNTKFLRGGVLRNGGAAQWTQGSLYVDGGGTLSNRLGGTFDVAFDGTVGYSSGAAGAVYNAGLWRKSGGTNVASINIPFHNGGTLSLWQGTLNFALAPTLSQTGTIEFALAGVSYPSGCGRVTTSQPLQLAGRLEVTFRNGFIPGPGLQYDVVAAPILGQVQSFTAPVISPYVFINPVHKPNLVQLVTTDPTPLVTGMPSFDAQKRVVLNIQGIVNQRYAVAATTNFVSWLGLQTNTIPVSTIWQFVDTDSATLRCRFYRVMFLP